MMRLVIGNKNYSTWSLRPWMLLDAFGLPFEEQLVSLAAPNLSERLAAFSDTCRVPVLIDGTLTVWDSLAICDTISEKYLSNRGWPASSNERATARAICCEMHAGFQALRNEMPMNCRASRIVDLSAAAQRDVQRVDDIWARYSRPDAQGDLRLFGEFSIADCFYAPVVMRFITYDIKLSAPAQSYLESMRAHPSLEKWVAHALTETEVLDEDEAGTDR